LAERQALGYPLLLDDQRTAWFAAHPEEQPAGSLAPDVLATMGGPFPAKGQDPRLGAGEGVANQIRL
jgi:hypothetical protein